jgi:decaprenylphospho-beta-D-ribofuranose 2-oxidase
MISKERPSSAQWTPARRVFTSFDRTYQAQADYFTPDRYSFWDDCASSNRYAMSRGAGLSYAAATFRESGTVVEHGRFNRLLDFDSARAVLEVEAGTTLGQIFDFSIRRGLFLGVQPGHPAITAGGCIGPDVHGKNQFRDGTFISCVESLRLFHPRHGILDLSAQQEPKLFRLTCGGYGLTGNILSARLRLTKAPSSTVAVRILPLDDIANLPEVFSDLAEKVDLLYSWHDFTARGRRFGSGFIVTGTFDKTSAPDSGKVLNRTYRAIDSSLARQMPISLWNRWSLPLFNRVYKLLSKRYGASRSISIYSFLFPVADKISYFHLFGKRGFHECQIILPVSTFGGFVDETRAYLNRHRVPVSLASAKLFRGSRELVRFTGDGICLALDFPHTREAVHLLDFLDNLMCDCCGWPNPIKDSRLSAAILARTYPEYDAFRRMLREFDPQRSYRSEMSDRLGL